MRTKPVPTASPPHVLAQRPVADPNPALRRRLAGIHPPSNSPAAQCASPATTAAFGACARHLARFSVARCALGQTPSGQLAGRGLRGNGVGGHAPCVPARHPPPTPTDVDFAVTAPTQINRSHGWLDWIWQASDPTESRVQCPPVHPPIDGSACLPTVCLYLLPTRSDPCAHWGNCLDICRSIRLVVAIAVRFGAMAGQLDMDRRDGRNRETRSLPASRTVSLIMAGKLSWERLVLFQTRSGPA